jgi:hypothetical protein
MSLRKSLYGLAAAAALMAGAQAQAETAPAPVYAVAKPAKAAKIAKAPTRAAPAAQAHAPVLQVQAAPAARPAPTERDIAVLFDLWNAALQTGSPELVASLYAPDGVLLPTVSNRVRTTRAEIVDYFQHFLALQPRGTINQSFIGSWVRTWRCIRASTPSTWCVRASRSRSPPASTTSTGGSTGAG